jgi:hypothetical protein
MNNKFDAFAATNLFFSTIEEGPVGLVKAAAGIALGPFGFLLHPKVIKGLGDLFGGENSQQDKVWLENKMKAVLASVTTAKERTNEVIWEQIEKEVGKAIKQVERTSRGQELTKDLVNKTFDSVFDAIHQVDEEVYKEFLDVYQIAARKLGV